MACVDVGDESVWRMSYKIDSDTEHVSIKLYAQYEKVSADMIDVWMGNQKDSELWDFYNRGGFSGALTEEIWAFDYQVVVPTLDECLFNYYKLLHEFTCPESKKKSRQLKYKALKDMGDHEKRLAEMQAARALGLRYDNEQQALRYYETTMAHRTINSLPKKKI
jgi:hypothetical protein